VKNFDSIINLADYFEKVIGRGLLKIAILLILESRDYHGYKIYKIIKTKIYKKLSLSTLYTALFELTKMNVIDKIGGIYKLTDNGRKVLNILRSKYPFLIASLELIFQNIQ